MKAKERLLNVIKGKEVDRIPWSPFLAYFWEHQDKKVQEAGQFEFLKKIGADPMFRGSHQLFKKIIKNCEVLEKKNGKYSFVEYHTPVGMISEKSIYSKEGNTNFLIEHPVKKKEDFKILQYINENTVIEADYEAFEKDYSMMGDSGLLVPIIGSELKSSFQSLIEHWVGTEELVYAIFDYPEIVEECLSIMNEVSLETVKISVESSAEAFIFWEDSSTTNYSPSYFEKYIGPQITEWAQLIHSHDKYLIHHACGHIKDLIPHMLATGIDSIESISPPPTGNIELWEAFDLIPEDISLIGGIEPTIFLNSSLDELEEYVIKLIRSVGDRRFILANSDSCPPGVSVEKFELVSEIVRNINKYI